MQTTATGAGLAPEVVQDLDAITVPVLVMDGGDSRSTMRTCADAIAAHLSHGRRRTPAGHGERLVRLGTRLVARFPLVPGEVDVMRARLECEARAAWGLLG